MNQRQYSPTQSPSKTKIFSLGVINKKMADSSMPKIGQRSPQVNQNDKFNNLSPQVSAFNPFKNPQLKSQTVSNRDFHEETLMKSGFINQIQNSNEFKASF